MRAEEGREGGLDSIMKRGKSLSDRARPRKGEALTHGDGGMGRCIIQPSHTSPPQEHYRPGLT